MINHQWKLIQYSTHYLRKKINQGTHNHNIDPEIVYKLYKEKSALINSMGYLVRNETYLKRHPHYFREYK